MTIAKWAALSLTGALLAGPAPAQEAASLAAGDSEDFGPHLIGPGGKPLYLFTPDGTGSAGGGQVTCAERCLDKWPVLAVDAPPKAGPGLEADMVGTVAGDGRTVATYNGWPLYTYREDRPGEPPQGHDLYSFGGWWRLVSPSGGAVEEISVEAETDAGG